ncbi:DUF2959 domain-containing protein [soil metagenome]
MRRLGSACAAPRASQRQTARAKEAALTGQFQPGRAVRACGYAVTIVLLSACSSPYYNVMERLGFPKRDILVDRVEAARDSQEQAAEQFKDALEQFIAVTGFKGGALQEKYDQLEAEYEQSEARATEVHQRVDGVEDVAEALFNEWEAELDQYTSAPLRRSSVRQLEQTRAQYGQLLRAMKRAEAKMGPVLAAFHDRVLFLKHNLNARAIASLKGSLASIEADIAVLIREMEASIREANRFIDAMKVAPV